jgi:hypothetical protein
MLLLGMASRKAQVVPQGRPTTRRGIANLFLFSFHPRNVVNAFIDAPSRFDVLFGKGKALREHTGNVRANRLVAMYRPKYEQAADKYDKTDIAKRLVNIIHESNGQFLKFEENEGCWVEVGHGMALEKTSHVFEIRGIEKEGTIATESSRLLPCSCCGEIA